MTIARLRQQSLKDLIREHGGRYCLDPAAAIVRVERWSR